MRLPNADRVVIEPTKVRDYLLSPSHPVGRFKAAFFAALGYSEADWQELDADLRALASAGDAQKGKPSSYGQKYEVRGILAKPGGRRAEVITVWMVRTGENVPRFVTAHPGG